MIPQVRDDVSLSTAISSFGAKRAIAPKDKMTTARKFGKYSAKSNELVLFLRR
jgi:hypothetical protein